MLANCLVLYKCADYIDSTLVVNDGLDTNGSISVFASAVHTDNGKVGAGFLFDGSSHRLSTLSTFQSALRSAFSVSGFFKLTDGQSATQQTLFGIDSGTFSFGLQCACTTDGRLFARYTGAEQNLVDTFTVQATSASTVFVDGVNDWKHIVMVVEQQGINVAVLLYVNGILIRTATASSKTMQYYTSMAPMHFGAIYRGGYIEYTAGYFDCLMCFNRALRQSEVIALYNNGNGVEDLTMYSMKFTPGLYQKMSSNMSVQSKMNYSSRFV